MLGLCLAGVLSDSLRPPVFADDAADADALQKQTNELFNAGKFQQAFPLQQRILELRERTVGPEHLLVALSCQNLSYLCQKMRDFEKSKSFRKRQLAILEKQLGSQHPAIAQGFAEMAALDTEMGDYAEAERLYQRALEMFEKTSGLENLYVAGWMSRQGELYDKMGNFSKAEPILLRALAIAEKTAGPENVSTGNFVGAIAKIYRQHNEYAKAEKFFTRALAILEKNSGTDRLQAVICDSLMELYLVTGDNLKAVPFAQRALAIRERTLGPEYPDTAQSLKNLAMVYMAVDDSAKADALYERAQRILEKTLGPDHPNTLHCRQLRANGYALMGDDEKALALMQQVLTDCERVLGPEHNTTRTSVLSLEALYSGTGNYKMAEQLLQRALTGRTTLERAAYKAQVLTEFAYLYSRMGDHAKAGPFYEQALAAGEECFGPEHLNTAYYLRNLAHHYLVVGDYAKVEPLLRRAMAIYEKLYGSEHLEIAKTLNNLAWYFLAEQKPDRALESREKEWRIREKRREQVFTFASERQQASFVEMLRDRIDENISQAAWEMPNNPAARRFALAVVLSTKGVILESIAQRQSGIVHSSNPELKNLHDQCLAANSVLSQALMTPAPQGRLAAHLAYITDLEKQKEALEEALGRASAAFATERQGRHVTVADVARAMPAGSVLVEFTKYRPFKFEAKNNERRWGDWNYIALVLRGGEKPDAADVALVPLGPVDKIETAIRYWRKVFDVTLYRRAGVSLPAFEPAPKELAELIWKPILPALGDCRKIYISPDGELAFVNFGALPGRQPDRFAIEDFDISYVTTGRDLMRSGTGQGNPPLLVGAPDYGTRWFQKDVLSFLPGTLAEVNAIASLMKQSGENPTLLTGGQATEAAVKAAKHPRILHLATHGFFFPDVEWDWLTDQRSWSGFGDGGSGGAEKAQLWRQIKKENPMRRSGVALAGANETLRGNRESGENDGILTAEKVAGMDLWGTQLVVISACESGLGKSRGGEGVFGLRRAFVLAGAQNLVMTLWPVNDEKTSDLMGIFYQHLQTEGTPQRALLGAQREWIAKERSSGRKPHPCFWAAFVASGIGFGLEEKAK